MNIGLSYLTQIRGGEDTGQLTADTDAQNGTPSEPETLGGWVALTFNQIVAALTAGYHREHNADDTHGNITCDAISERDRSVANGVWTDVPFTPTNFAGSGAMTVTVASQIAFAYTFYGKTMTVAFQLSGISIGGTPDTFIKIRIPGVYTSKRATLNTVVAYDNSLATAKLAYAAVQSPSASAEPYIFCALATTAAWTASAANTLLYGQLTFEVN